MYDIIIIGGGPAGVCASIYAKRGGANVLLLEKEIVGGQAGYTSEIENYPGLMNINGYEFSSVLLKQLLYNEIEIKYETAEKINKINSEFIVLTKNNKYHSRCVIIANGVKRRLLQCKGEKEFTGKGVCYCAICDGGFFKNKTVTVVGGGNSALEESLYLSDICDKVFLIHRDSEYKASASLIKRVNKKENIIRLMNSSVEEICGDEKVNSVIVNKEGATEKIKTDGVFISIGKIPDNDKFTNVCRIDKQGYIITDENCKCPVDGVFGAGDTRSKKIRQIITAESDGAIASSSALDYLKSTDIS